MRAIEKIEAEISRYRGLESFYKSSTAPCVMAKEEAVKGCAFVIKRLEEIRDAHRAEVEKLEAELDVQKRNVMCADQARIIAVRDLSAARVDVLNANNERTAAVNELKVARNEYRRAMDEQKAKLVTALNEVKRLVDEKNYWENLYDRANADRWSAGQAQHRAETAAAAAKSEAQRLREECGKPDECKVASRAIGVPRADDVEKALRCSASDYDPGAALSPLTFHNSNWDKSKSHFGPIFTDAGTLTIKFVDEDSRNATVADVRRIAKEEAEAAEKRFYTNKWTVEGFPKGVTTVYEADGKTIRWEIPYDLTESVKPCVEPLTGSAPSEPGR